MKILQVIQGCSNLDSGVMMKHNLPEVKSLQHFLYKMDLRDCVICMFPDKILEYNLCGKHMWVNWNCNGEIRNNNNNARLEMNTSHFIELNSVSTYYYSTVNWHWSLKTKINFVSFWYCTGKGCGIKYFEI